jgi:uncharacterized protein (TIGR00730 family)
MKFKHNKKYLNSKWTVKHVSRELDSGLKLLNKIDEPIISIFGSHRPKPGTKYYKHAYALGYELGREGFAIVTGGGPGIMEASNKGAMDAGAVSIGIKAGLIKKEKTTDDYFTSMLSYQFLFVRRFIMSLKSNALVFYPGGFGTLNEFFEYVVLIQLAFIDKVPVICVDKNYWKGMFEWLKTVPKKEDFYINAKRDLGLIQFANTPKEIVKLIKKAGL